MYFRFYLFVALKARNDTQAGNVTEKDIRMEKTRNSNRKMAFVSIICQQMKYMLLKTHAEK